MRAVYRNRPQLHRLFLDLMHNRRVRVVVLGLLVCARVAFATSYAPPEKHDVWSADRQFVLHVDPVANVQTIASGRATLWSFSHDVGFAGFYLSNDGRSVAVVSWRFVRVEDLDAAAVEVWNAGGMIKSYSYRDLIARPPRIHGVGPIGSFWRDWLAGAAIDDGRLDIVTTGAFSYSIDLVTGEIADLRWSLDGVMIRILGFAMLAFAGVLALRTRRAMQRDEAPSDRHRALVAALVPIGALVWLWLELAGIPFVPANAVDWIELGVLVASLVMVPASVIASARLPRGARSGWLVANLAAPVVLLGVRFAC